MKSISLLVRKITDRSNLDSQRKGTVMLIDKKIKERFDAWWKCEVADRALIQAWAPAKGREGFFDEYNPPGGSFHSYKIISKWKEMGFDHGYYVTRIKEGLSNIYYGGDAFPIFFSDICPITIASFLGSEVEFREDTAWSYPIIEDWESAKNIKLKPESRFWQLAKGFVSEAAKKSGGDYFVTSPDIGMGLDIISQLRGTEKLLMDLLYNPEEVKALDRVATDTFIYCFRKLAKLAKVNQDNFMGWLPVYSEGLNYPLQCDFSAMISPGMFEEFVLPGLIEVAESLDKAAYHLDGPDAVRHLDLILDIPKISAIQWVPGAGSPTAASWIPMLKKIQAKKKALYLYAENPGEVEKLMMELDPEGLLISIPCKSEEEADDVVKIVGRLSLEKLKNR